MYKCKIGDVLSISTNKGFAFFQFVKQTGDNCELIRILPGLYEHVEDFNNNLIAEKELFFLHFPLHAAKRKRLVDFVGKFPLPKGLVIPTKFRSKFISPKDNSVSWYIFEEDVNGMKYVGELNEKVKHLSDWGVWNDTLLKERLEEGWSLDKWV